MLSFLRTMSSRLMRRPLAHTLVRRLTYMLALVAATTPFALLAPPPVRWVAAALIWLCGSAWATSNDDSISGYTMICALVPTFMVAFGLSDYVATATSRRVTGITVAEAPRHPEAQAFEFSDARVWGAYAATYHWQVRDSKSGRITTMDYLVAPLAGPRWTPTEPVPAWVGCSERYVTDTCAGWEDGYRAGIAVDSQDQADLRQAVAIAIAKHGLREAPGAPLLLLSESIQAGQRQRAGTVFGGMIGGYLLAVIPMLISAAWDTASRLLRRRSST
jgi:hypothetical protein